MDFMDIKDFIEEKGIPEMNIEYALDYAKNPRYVNNLKFK